MRHRVKTPTLDRIASQRNALLKTLAISLLTNGKIKTTPAKAKAVQGIPANKVRLVRQAET